MRALIRQFIILLFMTNITTMAYAKTATALFAGGCFWCMEADFDKVPGVLDTISGYTGGGANNPTYKQVSNGGTGHYETVKVIYDTNKISYQKLLDVFWRSIDPTDPTGQFCDKGTQYRAAIFYLNGEQEKLAKASKKKLENSKRFPRVVTQILPAKKFYRAEDYHQNYYKRNPVRYKYYRYRCGRDQRLEKLWG